MPKTLDQQTFLKSFEFVPRAAINLLTLDQDNQFLLTKRAIQPHKGLWHYPGSFLLKGESISQCLQRIAQDEIDIKIDSSKAILIGVFENLGKDPRGHIVDIIYKYKISKNQKLPSHTFQSQEISFFSKIPEDTGFNHGENLRKMGLR